MDKDVRVAIAEEGVKRANADLETAQALVATEARVTALGDRVAHLENIVNALVTLATSK